MYAFVYQSLLKQIGTIKEVVQVDVFNDQPMRRKQEEAFDLPAVYIEFKPIQWNHRASGRRVADIQIDFHLETDMTGKDSAGITPEEQRERGLAYMRLLDDLYACLAGFGAAGDITGFNGLTLTAEQLNVNSGVTREDIISFTTHVEDDSAVAQTVVKTLAQGVQVSGE